MPRKLYSLFSRKRGSTRWTRVLGTGAYRKELAIRIFQTRLINGAFDPEVETMLRPLPPAEQKLAHYILGL